MSNGSSAAVAVGLGVVGGAAVWFFTRDKTKPAGAAASTPETPTAQPTTASSPTVGPPPPRVPGPCSLKVDKTGLTADGERVDVATAVERCKTAGAVEWALMPDAPSAIVVELSKALHAAKLPLTMKR